FRGPDTPAFPDFSKGRKMNDSKAGRTAITAVIVNYGSPDDTVGLARALEGQVARILAVDNSGDLTAVPHAPAGLEILSPGRNLGYGAAVNLAAAQCATRWLLVLNPDVRPLDDCIDQLWQAARQHDAPLAGPRFYWDDACDFLLPPALGYSQPQLFSQHLHAAGAIAHYSLARQDLARHEAFWQRQEPFVEPFLSGACLLVDLDWFRAQGEPVFDERFFLYYEDTDLCARLLGHGRPPLCVPAARAVHYWNQAPQPAQGKLQLMMESEARYRAKFYSQPLPRPAIEQRYTPPSQDLGEHRDSPQFDLPAGTARLDFAMD